jgi:predicted nucleic acid-binding protein
VKLIDTVAIIGFLNPKDRLHARSVEHLESVSSEHDGVAVPVSALIETDLLLKISGYDDSEREISWGALGSKIPSDKIVPNSIPSIRRAIDLQRQGLDYFDSLIASLAKTTDSSVITTDRRIGDVVRIDW